MEYLRWDDGVVVVEEVVEEEVGVDSAMTMNLPSK